ncbi:MAG: hypothetical protein AAFO76_11245 [Cyanobacteria bacterium J06607_15]
MYCNISPRLLFCLSVGIVCLQGISFPLSAQQVFSATPVSPEAIATAQQLAQQSKAKVDILDYRGAIADISQAIRLNPHEADFYYQRGLILGELSDRAGAVQDFDDAILRNPNHARAYLQRAGMSFNLGSSFQLRDSRGLIHRFDDIADDRRGDARAILDLRTARDLFAQQGDEEGYRTADLLLQHFAGDV